MTVEDARKRATILDQRVQDEIAARIHGDFTRVFSEIRAYLLRRTEETDSKNNPIQLLRLHRDRDTAVILLGPTLDKGPTPEHFNFDSGARLSFGVTLRQRGRDSQVIAFRFHYQFPPDSNPAFFRFDLADTDDPLREPRIHLHPGVENIRIPIALMDPLEILDRIFFVVEKRFQ